MLCAILRVGRKGGFADNASAGGIFVNVDTRSFETSGDCYAKRPEVKCHGPFHPDTKVELSGVKIPYSDEIKKLVLEKAAFAFFEHPYLGWDVAITTGGPCLIEVNLGFGGDGIQIAAGRGLRDEFQYDPNKSYKQKSKWTEVSQYWRRLEGKS